MDLAIIPLSSLQKYCTARKELISIIVFTRQYRYYLLGRNCLIRTDHNSLVWLTKFRNIQGQLARWLEELSQYDFSIIHGPGKLHGNADGMSHIPDTLQPCAYYIAGVEVTSLPCGGCPYCTQTHHQWERLTKDVDDVIPLAMRTVTTHIGDTQSALSDDEEVSMDQDEEIQLVGYTPENLREKMRIYSLIHQHLVLFPCRGTALRLRATDSF